MLVLGRSRGEKIVVSGPCIITIVAEKHDYSEAGNHMDKTRIGIDAHPSTTILRGEIINKLTGRRADEVIL